jgi:replication-associated recombination protein RarA
MKTEIKYAPDSINQVIYPNVSVQRRIAAYAAGQLEGHVMLYGTNGTGKTTVAKLLVQAIGGADALLEDKDIDELLGMPKFKDYMKNICSVARLTASGKYFMVLNEFDKTKKEVSKFWTALDACGENVMVIITTNHAMEIDRAIRSRFDMIEMSGIPAVQAIQRVQLALKAEGLSLPDAQVLHYLKQVENLMDFRKYFKKADELLFLHSNGLAFPAWKAAAPALKII